jgi:hypothetical protein
VLAQFLSVLRNRIGCNADLVPAFYLNAELDPGPGGRILTADDDKQLVPVMGSHDSRYI